MPERSVETKKCTKCEKRQPISFFSKPNTWCKECRKKYVFNNREDHKKRCKKNAVDDKLMVLKYYSNGEIQCACCGEKTIEFLCIDHINGGGNKQRKDLQLYSGRGFYRYLINNDFPEGYRVLCHNCNMALGSFGFCPHNNLNHIEPIIMDTSKKTQLKLELFFGATG